MYWWTSPDGDIGIAFDWQGRVRLKGWIPKGQVAARGYVDWLGF